MKYARTILFLIAGLFMLASSTQAQKSDHCRFWPTGKWDDSAYFNECRLKILSAAGFQNAEKVGSVPPRDSIVDKPVSCILTLDASGHIGSLKILKNSDNKTNDQAALDILRKAMPFRGNPQIHEPLLVQFGTGWNVSVLPVSKNDAQELDKNP